MNSYQSKIVGLCLALTETIWLYSILAVLGLMVSIDRSPLTYGACFAIYVTSFYLSKLLNSLNFKLSIAGIIQLSLGVIICYYLVGSSNVPTGEARSFLWPLSLDEWIYEEGKVGTSIVIAACMGVFMWVKGGRIGSTDFPLEALSSEFIFPKRKPPVDQETKAKILKEDLILPVKKPNNDEKKLGLKV